MATIAKIFPFAIIILLLAACSGNAPPQVWQAGQPTLVFIYTDN
ncbi:hypothetical protein ACFLXQ_00115 [Chloroflexota bacterium]